MTEFTVPSRADGHCEDDAAWSEMVRRYGPMDRSRLCMGEKSDFLLANAQFLVDRNSLDLIAYQTAAKDRIRWLSVQLAIALRAVEAAAELRQVFHARQIAEAMDEGDGFWKACSGCQEGVDGHVSEKDYPFDPVFRCRPGGGCSECGGLGVLWDDTDYDAMAKAMAAEMEAEDAQGSERGAKACEACGHVGAVSADKIACCPDGRRGVSGGVIERVAARAQSLERIGADQDASDLRAVLSALDDEYLTQRALQRDVETYGGGE